MNGLKLALPPYLGVAMIALGRCMGGEENPSVEVAIFRCDLDPGESDSRLSCDANLGLWQVRIFRGSLCGLIIAEDGCLKFAEPGLQGFVGKLCTVVRHKPSDGDYFLIVWRDAAGSINEKELNYVARRIHGLREAFV